MTTDTAAPQSRRHALADALMNQSYAVRNGRTIDHIVLEEAALELRTAAARSEAQPSGYDGPVVYLRDVGGIASDGQYDECWAVCSKGDPGALTFTASLSDASEVEGEIGPPTPLDALKFRMEQGGHSQTDFAKLIGNRSHASEILAGKRSLSKAMIATLADEWGIPARSLLGPGITASLSAASPSSGDE